MINKAKNNRPFNVLGSAITYLPFSTGVYSVDRVQNEVFSTGVTNGISDSAPASWNFSGFVNSTGTVIFNNNVHGGSLSSVLVANRSAGTVYVGFNSETPSTAAGFPLASGESLQYDQVDITEAWAITASSSGMINAQGLYRTDI